MSGVRSPRPLKSRPLRYVLIAVGFVSIALGVLGIVLPLLPTTPFLLLAAACFARSSRRFHDWLLNVPHLGQYIRDYEAGAGIPVAVKVAALSVLWASILATVIWILPQWWIKMTLLAIAGGVSIHILRLPVRRSR